MTTMIHPYLRYLYRAVVLFFLLCAAGIAATCQVPAPKYEPATVTYEPATPVTQELDAPSLLVQAGEELEVAGRRHNTAVLVSIVSLVLGSSMVLAADGDPTMMAAGGALGGAGFVISLGVNIGSGSAMKHAGQHLQDFR